MTGISRRALLGSLGAGGLVLAGGLGMGAASGGQVDLLRRMLVRLIGPFRMDDAEFARFAADFAASRAMPGTAQVDLLRLGEVLGATGAAERLPGSAGAKIASRIEQLERDVLTQFVLATRAPDPPGGEILHYGGLFAANACNNPYAQFG
ncbi:MAG: hypothetical protein RLZZ08_134 [Pseudomonadota bacterium]|jgi:hypothetical protein